MLLFSLVILAHLLGDFVFQTNQMVANKLQIVVAKRALIVHSATHFVLVSLCLIPLWFTTHSGSTIILCLMIPCWHGIIDWLKSYYETHVEHKWGGPTQWLDAILERGLSESVHTSTEPRRVAQLTKLCVFLGDQLLHIVVILFSIRVVDVSAFVHIASDFQYLMNGRPIRISPVEHVIMFAIIGLCATVVSGIIVQIVTEPAPIAEKYILDDKVTITQTTSDGHAETKHTTETSYINEHSQTVPRGRMIGYFERVLILFAVCMGAYSAIGFIVAAKSLARLKKLDNPEWAEYFLVGTLCSLLCGTLSGLALKLWVS